MSRSLVRKSVWSAIWRWRGNCNFGCCRNPCRSLPTSKWRPNLFPRVRSAATCTTSSIIRRRRMGMVIGDVSGKGAPAAIYAALVSGILRSHAPIEPGPAEMLRAVNFSLGERRIEGQFVSLIYAVWDDDSRSLQVANSGLPRPVYCHDGKIEIIEATGLPLGLFDDAEYDEFTFKA